MAGKPVAIIGASPGVVGTARAQAQLKQVLLGTLSELFPYPEVVVGKAYERIRDGQLTDDETREFLRTMLGRYIDWNGTLVG